MKIDPFGRIKLFFQGLSGAFDTEMQEDEGYSEKDLEELNKMSKDTLKKLEKDCEQNTEMSNKYKANKKIKNKKNAKEEEYESEDIQFTEPQKEETDRLGIEKPYMENKEKRNFITLEQLDETEDENEIDR